MIEDRLVGQIISGYLDEASREILATLVKTAYSLNIKERRDCSSSILDQSGDIVALTAHGGIHLGSMLGLVENVLQQYSLSEMNEGDLFLVNDPFGGGGSHLPDFTMAAPVMAHGKLVAFVANIAHQSDIGGAHAGSISGVARDIFSEGLRIPAVRLRKGDVMNSEILEITYQNSRLPEERRGDINAQIGALAVGSSRMAELVSRYGADVVIKSMAETKRYSEERIRSRIREIPDGEYEAAEWLDLDDWPPRSVEIRLKVTIAGDQCTFDFTGTSPQLASSKNVPTTALRATVYTVVKQMLDPGLPPNAGYYSAIEISAPPGCLVNPQEPAAVGDRALTCNIIGDVIAQAISQAVPESAMAGSGPYCHSVISGRHPDGDRRFFVNFESLAGSEGALAYRDGMDAVRVHASGGLNQSIEAMELAYPLRVVGYGFVEDSGGVGRYRGGLATCRDVMALGPGCQLSGSTARTSEAAYGAQGGGPGSLAEITILRDETERLRPGINFSGFLLEEGDVVRLVTPGGGGYGEPDERDPEEVLEDVNEDRVSVEGARRDYGVVIVDGAVDYEATEASRAERRSNDG